MKWDGKPELSGLGLFAAVDRICHVSPLAWADVVRSEWADGRMNWGEVSGQMAGGIGGIAVHISEVKLKCISALFYSN